MAASVCIVKNFLVGLLLKFIITRIVVIDSPHIESTQFHFNDSYFTNSFTNRLSGLVKKFQIYRLCISLCGLLQYDICNHTNKRKHYQFISHFGQYTKKDLIYKQTIYCYITSQFCCFCCLQMCTPTLVLAELSPIGNFLAVNVANLSDVTSEEYFVKTANSGGIRSVFRV